MIRTIISTLLVPIFLSIIPLRAVGVEIINDIDDIVLSKKVWIRFVLRQSERGIFKKNLQFSIDRCDISLTSWHSLMQPVRVFIPAFKRTKKMFPNSLTGWLTVDGGMRNLDELKKCLSQAHIGVSCFIVCNNGTVKPMSIVLPFFKNDLRIGQQRPLSGAVMQSENTDKAIEVHQGYIAPDVTKDFEPLEKLEQTWSRFCTWIRGLHKQNILLRWYVIVVLLFAIFWLRRRYRLLYRFISGKEIWEREIRHLLGFISIGGLLMMLGIVIPQDWVLYAVALLCLIGMLYISVTPPQNETLLGRMRQLVGLLCGSLVLPLVVQAYLISMR